MILVKVGSQKFQFNRLLKKVDDLIEEGIICDDVIAQTGHCTYQPKHYEGKAFMSREEMAENMKKADIVLTHGGTASIMESVEMGKRVVAVPRNKEYNEHVDDHQEEIIKQLSDDGIIEGCMDIDDLGRALETARNKEYLPYISKRDEVIEEIRKLL